MHSSTYKGKTYYFAGVEPKKMFDAAPAKYLPKYAGYCATAMAIDKKIESDPEIFSVHKGSTHLFSSKEAKAAFDSDPNGTMVFVLMTIMVLAVSSGTAADTYWVGKPAPELAAGEWINSKRLSLKELHGKVVLLEFWTFGCYNCLNTLPHIKAWHRKYAGAEFEIIGVHTPEFDREKDLKVVKWEVAHRGVAYAVVTDSEYATWNRYKQQYWPALYLVDKKGIIRYIHIGEGDYEETEQQITSLIGER